MSSKKHTRYKVLLDEGLPPRARFPQLNNLHTVRHIKHDLKKGGAKDPEIYRIAGKDRYIVVVFNTKDFEPLISSTTPTVVFLSTGLSNEQIDLRVCSVLRKLKPSQKNGHMITITNEGENVKEVKNRN